MLKEKIVLNSIQNAPRILKNFLIYMETIRGKSPKTVNEYFLDLRMFFRFLKSDGDKISSVNIDDIDINFIKNITLSDVYDFLSYTAKIRPKHQNSKSSAVGLIASSRARKTSSIKAFFKYLTDKEQVLEFNPVQNLDAPKIKKSLPVYLSIDDSMSLLECVDGKFQHRDYAILTLFLNCGLRVSELVDINLNDIQDRFIKITGKGDKERVLYLNDACIGAINEYLPYRIHPKPEFKNALFVSRQSNRIATATVKHLCKKFISLSGLDSSKYSAHKLRHTAATLMYQNGVDIRTLQEVLGHKNVDTTMIYTHIADKSIADAINSNPLAKVKHKKQ